MSRPVPKDNDREGNIANPPTSENGCNGIAVLDSEKGRFRFVRVAGMSENQNQRYRQIVESVTEFAQQLSSEPLRIHHFCRTVGISKRILRRAFHHVHGISPCRYIRRLRMIEVMKALSSTMSPNATVTQIATDFGFVELGRFAVEYRTMFGECPSATLRRAQASRAAIDAAYVGRRSFPTSDRSRTAQVQEVRA